MSVLDVLGGSSAGKYEPIETVCFSTDGEAIVTLASAAEVDAIEVLDEDGELVQSRMLYDAQWVATLPLRQNQPVEHELVGGGTYTYRVPRSERHRLDLPDGDPLPPGDYTFAAGETGGDIQRKQVTIPPEATLTDG